MQRKGVVLTHEVTMSCNERVSVVLTTSKEEEDIAKAYDNHANCYIKKPEDLVGFWEVVRKTEDFWLSVVKLPAA